MVNNDRKITTMAAIKPSAYFLLIAANDMTVLIKAI
jgi:hypothetical protein